MTPVGHSLVGASIGLITAPSTAGRWRKLALILSFVVLANLPDARLKGWGHDRYDISHSIFVNLGLIALVCTALACAPRVRRFIGGPRVMIGATAAWLSHLLLDSFYNHGQGIAIFWPLSSARLALRIPLFDHIRHPYLDLRSMRVMGIELLAYGTLLLLVWIARRIYERYGKRAASQARIPA